MCDCSGGCSCTSIRLPIGPAGGQGPAGPQGPAGADATINPTDGYIPYNNLGNFADSPFSTDGTDIYFNKKIRDTLSPSYLDISNGIAYFEGPTSGNGTLYRNANGGSFNMAWYGAGALAGFAGAIAINQSDNEVFHTIACRFTAPKYIFSNSTASSIPYFNASQELTGMTTSFSDGSKMSFGTLALTAKLSLVSVTEQLRSGYDDSNYWKVVTTNTGTTTFTSIGSVHGFNFNTDAFNVTSGSTNTSTINATNSQSKLSFAETATSNGGSILVSATHALMEWSDVGVGAGEVEIDVLRLNLYHSEKVIVETEILNLLTTTSANHKISFWGATADVQPTTAIAGATFVALAGTAVNDASTFDGYTIRQIVAALRRLGLLA